MFKAGKYKITGITLLLMVISMFTWAWQHQYFKAKTVRVKKSADTLNKTIVYDKELLKKFSYLSKKYDSIGKGNYTFSGILNMIDGADTSQKVNNLGFLMCKSGSDFYYKLGETETLNQDGLYLVVDNDTKRVILSKKKDVNYEQANPKMFTHMAENLSGEQYNMYSSLNKGVQTISLVNERHITCKQYAMSFDTANMQLEHLHLRLTNFEQPLRKDKEQVIDVKIAQFESKADLEKYLTANEVVKKQGQSWKTTDRFANYELIIR